jgi:hypothetical protein
LLKGSFFRKIHALRCGRKVSDGGNRCPPAAASCPYAVTGGFSSFAPFDRMPRAKQAIGKCLGFLCQGRRLDGFLLSEGQPIIGRCSPPGPPAFPGLQVSLFRADGLHPRTCSHPFSGAEFFRRLSVPGLCVFGRFFARMRPMFLPPAAGSWPVFPAAVRKPFSCPSASFVLRFIFPKEGPPGVDFAALFVPRDPDDPAGCARSRADPQSLHPIRMVLFSLFF